LAWPLRLRVSRPVAASHTFTVPSSEALARRWPSGLKATLVTPPAWPWRGRPGLPRRHPHHLTSPGRASSTKRKGLGFMGFPVALARRWPSGLKATLVTQFAWPLRLRVSRPVCASHTFTVPSLLPLARRRPSVLKATLVTPPTWPGRGRSELQRRHQ